MFMIFAVLLCYLGSSERKARKKFWPEATQTLTSVMPVQCSASCVILKANWELSIMRVNDKPIDSGKMCIKCINEISFELQMKTLL